MFVHGTSYLFRVTIAILKLTQDDLLRLDISGINDYFRALKEESNGPNRVMPEIETIIKESLKIKLNEEKLDALAKQYKVVKSPRRSERASLHRLEVVKKPSNPIANIVQQVEEEEKL